MHCLLCDQGTRRIHEYALYSLSYFCKTSHSVSCCLLFQQKIVLDIIRTPAVPKSRILFTRIHSGKPCLALAAGVQGAPLIVVQMGALLSMKGPVEILIYPVLANVIVTA